MIHHVENMKTHRTLVIHDLLCREWGLKRQGYGPVASTETKGKRHMIKRYFFLRDIDIKNQEVEMKIDEQAEREFKVLIKMKGISPGFDSAQWKCQRILEKK